MSLKHFHIVFVTVVTLFFAWLSWMVWEIFRAQDGTLHLVLALLASAATIGSVVYGIWFWKKMKNIIL